VPKKRVLPALLQVVPVNTLTALASHVLAVIIKKIAGARLGILILVPVVQYVSGAAIVAMLVPVHATREVSASSTLS